MTKAKELRETYVQEHQYTKTFKPKYALKTNSDNRNFIQISQWTYKT